MLTAGPAGAARAEQRESSTPDAALRARIRGERDQRPFASVEDFEKRAGVTLAALGAAPVK